MSMTFQVISIILLWSFGVFGKLLKIPNEPYPGPSHAEYKSGVGYLDGQKVMPWPNITSFEWWYFDVVSTTSTNESIVVVFYESTPEGFIGGLENSFISASLSGTFKNGTAFSIAAPVSAASYAEITYGPDEISGVWGDSGFGFHGKGVLNGNGEYTVEIHSPNNNVYGSIKIRSLAPAHYGCSSDLTYVSEVALPNIGWVNSIPDAIATVDLWIQDDHMNFMGTGYYDKNWGDKPFSMSLASSYWGHASVGPYSFVWSDDIGGDGKDYVFGFVAKNGKILQASCKPGAVKAKAYGVDEGSPGYPAGLSVVFDIGKAGILHLDVFVDTVLVALPIYFRFIGKATGKIKGNLYEGKAMAEHFSFN